GKGDVKARHWVALRVLDRQLHGVDIAAVGHGTSDKAGSVKVEADVGGVTSSTELSFVADNSTWHCPPRSSARCCWSRRPRPLPPSRCLLYRWSLPVTSDKAGSVKVEADVGGVTSSTELSFV
ncbi:hypothetical protein, partial [Serratia fonticola]